METSAARLQHRQVEITGSRVGAQKVSATQAIREYSFLGLADAKHAIDKVLDGSPVTIEARGEQAALDLARALEQLNFIVGPAPRD